MRQAIVNFHGIGAPRRALEPGEDAYWISREQFADCLVRICEARAGGQQAVITFDDGNISDIEIAAPLLAEHGLTATFFILAGRLGTNGALSESDVRDLDGAGHAIGCHGKDHVDWRAADGATLDRELCAAREHIADLTRTPVSAAAIPFGRYNARVLNALRVAGYKRVYSSDGGHADSGSWLQPRTSVRGDMTGADIDRLIAGSEPLRVRLKRTASMALKRVA